MASLSREAGGRWRIVWRDPDGRQRTLRLGKCTERAAGATLRGFELLLEARQLGAALQPDTVRWLAGVGDKLYTRFARLGLVQPRVAAARPTLGDLLQRFDASLTVGPGTRAAYKQATDSLREYFGVSRPLDSIGPGDAEFWRKHLVETKLAKATVAKRVNVAKLIFRRAVRWGLITTSPFADIKPGPQTNPDRLHYVGRGVIEAILEHCPDSQWRTIVALCRYAGLRCPSELVAMRWGDVNWERGRLAVRSPKTANYEGRGLRLVPIDPALRRVLLERFAEAEHGEELIVPRLRGRTAANLRTHFLRIIARAGVRPWPRLMHNLRSSCLTDWCEQFPAHVVACWAGHSAVVAAKHYLQVRDSHFDEAAGLVGSGVAAIPAAEAAAKAAAQGRAPNRTEAQNSAQPPAAYDSASLGDTKCCSGQRYRMGAAGFEPA